jgi:hypothetical protein
VTPLFWFPFESEILVCPSAESINCKKSATLSCRSASNVREFRRGVTQRPRCRNSQSEPIRSISKETATDLPVADLQALIASLVTADSFVPSDIPAGETVDDGRRPPWKKEYRSSQQEKKGRNRERRKRRHISGKSSENHRMDGSRGLDPQNGQAVRGPNGELEPDYVLPPARKRCLLWQMENRVENNKKRSLFRVSSGGGKTRRRRPSSTGRLGRCHSRDD